jgi:hypothetical protein
MFVPGASLCFASGETGVALLVRFQCPVVPIGNAFSEPFHEISLCSKEPGVEDAHGASQFLDIVLNGCSRDGEYAFEGEPAHRLMILGSGILEDMTFVKNELRPLLHLRNRRQIETAELYRPFSLLA